eukprot:10073269-Ditylum_brightwellii.AAC.1
MSQGGAQFSQGVISLLHDKTAESKIVKCKDIRLMKLMRIRSSKQNMIQMKAMKTAGYNQRNHWNQPIKKRKTTFKNMLH